MRMASHHSGTICSRGNSQPKRFPNSHEAGGDLAQLPDPLRAHTVGAEIRRGPDGVHPESIAQEESARQMVALGHEKGAPDAEEIPRSPTRLQGTCPSSILVDCVVRNAKPQRQFTHGGGLVVRQPAGAPAQQDPADGPHSIQGCGRPHPVGEDRAGGSRPDQPSPEDDRSRAGRGLGEIVNASVVAEHEIPPGKN